MIKILVDTNVIIDYLRRRDKKNSVFFKTFIEEKNRAALCLITVTELWAGKSMEKKFVLKEVNELIRKCTILLPNLKISKMAGKILRDTNHQIAFQDAVLAAVAIENKISLLTLNKKHFEKIEMLKIF